MSAKDGRTRVLFVCVGNACRSPMAEAIARLDAPDAIVAFSAGLTPIGYLAGMTKQTLLKNGYWMESLECKGISPEIWEQADIVINMTGRPREQAFPEFSKVKDWEIKDPFGGDADTYQKVFEKIRSRIAEFAEECRKEIAAARNAERRAHARVYVASPIFINVDGVNGGIAFNISEDGLGLSSVAALPYSPRSNMRIQFPGSQPWIDVTGTIAWENKFKGEAGIRFQGLTEAAHRQIRNWISTQAPAGELGSQTGVLLDEQIPLLEFPDASTADHAKIADGEVSNPPHAAAPAPLRPGLPASSAGINALAGKRPDRRAPQLPAKLTVDRRYLGVPRPTWGAFAAVGVLVGLFSMSMEWMTVRRDARSETSAAVTQEAQTSTEGVQPESPPSIVAAPKPPDAPDSGMEKMDSQPSGGELLVAEAHESIPNPAPANPVKQIRAAAHPAAIKILAAAARSTNVAPVRSQPPAEPARAAAGLDKSSLMKVQPIPVGNVAAKPQQPEPSSAPPVLVAANVPPADTKGIAALMPAAMQPPPPKITGAVAILADPYPSLRIPDGGVSKKQRQATSLQLGHLLSRVEPVYPEDAKQHGIQGTVKLHAIIGRQGAVQNLESVDGSPVLVAAAMNAVRQWRYTETLLAGQSVETEEDIAITFRLSNPAAPAN